MRRHFGHFAPKQKTSREKLILGPREYARLPIFKRMADLLLSSHPNPLEGVPYLIDIFFRELNHLCDDVGLERILEEEHPTFVLTSVLTIYQCLIQGICVAHWMPELSTLIRWTTNVSVVLQRTAEHCMKTWIMNRQLREMTDQMNHFIDYSIEYRLPCELFLVRMKDDPNAQETFQRFTDRILSMPLLHVQNIQTDIPDDGDDENGENGEHMAWFIPYSPLHAVSTP